MTFPASRSCIGVLIASAFHASFVYAATCVPAVWPAEEEKWTWHEDAGEGPGIHIATDIAFHDGTWYSVGTQRDYHRCAHYWPEGEEIHITLATSADGLHGFTIEDTIKAVDRIGDLDIEYGDHRNAFFPCFGKNPDGTPATYNGKFVLTFITVNKQQETIHQCLFSEDMKHWTDRTVVAPLSHTDEPEHTDPVREPQSFVRDDDGTWYLYYVAHAGDRGDAKITYSSGPSPIELSRSEFSYRDGKYESLDPILIRDAESWLVLYNEERAQCRYLRIDTPAAESWEKGEDYFESHHSPNTTTFAWAAIVNEAEKTVTWRMYQYTMKRYSDKSIQGGAFEATVALDETVGTKGHGGLRSAQSPANDNEFRPFGIWAGWDRSRAAGGLIFDCRGRAVFGGPSKGGEVGVRNRFGAAGLGIFSWEHQGHTSHAPAVLINDNIER